jgi:hypothetical protein
MMSVRFLDEAVRELDEAIAFYNARESSVGAKFADEIQLGTWADQRSS